MKKNEKTIILCAGQINHSLTSGGTDISNAMIPVNGKPVISWIIDDLIDKKINNIYIVLRENDTNLEKFISKIYINRIKITIISIKDGETILYSLKQGIDYNISNGLVRIILGDTLIKDTFISNNDFVYISPAEGSRRWCLANIDSESYIVDFRDKQPAGNGRPPALTGYYHLISGEDVKNCVEECILAGENEISSMLRRYCKNHKLKAVPVTEWYDFGHIDTLVESRRKLLKPRHFNQLTVNPILNTIIKESTNNQKLLDELDWYKEIPEELQILTPRLLKHQTQNDKVRIVQEYYGYSTLAELYVYGNLHPDTWHAILKHLLSIHNEFKKYKGSLSNKEIEYMYTNKTYNRMNGLIDQNPFWDIIIKKDIINVNSQQLINIKGLTKKIEKYSETISRNAPITIIHGDFCFSNILYDVPHQIARLIDPRGRFGKKGIWGDSRYDIAKLRHSVHEGYDFIQADLFELKESNEIFEIQLLDQKLCGEVGTDLDEMLLEFHYDLKEISFIEGLLFLSMIPLHKGQLDRQKMMYLTGIKLLNEVFNENSN
jgi:NDP-sugar pyrophosphorylase family protein